MEEDRADKKKRPNFVILNKSTLNLKPDKLKERR